MNRVLWVLQVITGIAFVSIGILHFVVPEGLPDAFSWMYDLSKTVHAITGAAEIAGGLGLILPAVTRRMPQLVPLAAVGLALIMIGAVVYHIGRGEYINIVTNLFWVALTSFIAFGRWKRHPIRPRTA